MFSCVRVISHICICLDKVLREVLNRRKDLLLCHLGKDWISFFVGVLESENSEGDQYLDRDEMLVQCAQLTLRLLAGVLNVENRGPNSKSEKEGGGRLSG